MILALPTFGILILGALLAALFSIGLYYIVHPFWARDLTEDTKRTADLVATRIGVVYAVMIGMMYANVRIEHIQMVEAIESEASSLIRLSNSIERQAGAEESREARKALVEYVKFIIEEQWPALREARILPGDRTLSGREHLDTIRNYVIRVEQQTGDQNLTRLFDQAEHFLILRLFDAKGNLLPLFWYIAFFGYIVSLLTLYVAPPTFRRCVLISFYSSMIVVVLLGIYILSHPYSAAAGVEPSIFKLLLVPLVQ